MTRRGSLDVSGANARDARLDVLKAAAIVAVFIYHLGFLPFGYLGVDIFLVINGYLVSRSMLRAADNDRFSYIWFLVRRIVRLWPIVLTASIACLIFGYFTMLPDDYENLGDSVVASNVFATNILGRITVRNYWDVRNDYKPLMHTWYLGVTVQSYFVLGLVPVAAKRIGKNVRKSCGAIFLTLTAVSLILYFIPSISSESKFYLLPFRLFEITAGAVVGSWAAEPHRQEDRTGKWNRIGQAAVFLLMLAILMIPTQQIPGNIKLVLICVGTVLLLIMQQYDAGSCSGKVLNAAAFLGKYTLGVFIWHQIIIAFFRYIIRAEFTALDVAVITCLTILLTVLTSVLGKVFGKVFERGDTKKNASRLLLACILPFMISTGLGLVLYMRGGVVRDVPELEITMNGGGRGINISYNDRVYDYDRAFADDGRIKVLAVGNSLARDLVNILLERDNAEDFDISYFVGETYTAETREEYDERIEQAKYIFYIGGVAHEPSPQPIPEFLQRAYGEGKVYVIGVKNFGESNGIIYNKRGEEGYFDQSIILDESYLARNEVEKEWYGDHLIDMIGAVQNADGSIPVFTPDGRFISQDCIHLTHAGAQYYAEILDLSWMI